MGKKKKGTSNRKEVAVRKKELATAKKSKASSRKKWWISLAISLATVAGFVLLGREWDDPAPELGWMLAPEHRGQGYATEAARALRDHGLTLLPDLFSYIRADNAASLRVAERLGATRVPCPFPDAVAYRHGTASTRPETPS